MNDSTETINKTLFEKIGDALSREPQDKSQLVELIRDAQTRDLLDAEALSMIESVLQVADMEVRDIMIPRPQMVSVQEHQAPDEFLPTIIDSGHSRFPVLGDEPDEVLGILLAKDLLTLITSQQAEKFNFRDILRPAIFVPESKRLNILLKEFRLNHNHMAMVVDEYGSIAGLVTIEDVLEQIVGDIEDEHDIEEEDFIKSLSDGTYTVKAHIPIEEFNDYFKTKFQHRKFDTMGGIVTHQFSHLPQRGEAVTIDNFKFSVLHADNRRIRLLQVEKI